MSTSMTSKLELSKDVSCHHHTNEETICSMRCMSCKSFMWQEIMQCMHGHNLCKVCYDNLWRCAQCSTDIITRNVSLEKIISEINFPCENTIYGCTFTGRPQHIIDHHVNCSFKIRLCPFNFYCDWTGQFREIQDHCREQHRHSTYFNAVNTKFFYLFRKQYQGLNLFVIFAYGCMFRVSFNLDLLTRSLQCGIYLVGEKNRKSEFSYEVRFLKNDTEQTGFTFKSNCVNLEKESDTFVDKGFLTVPLKVLHELCDGNGNLHYVITILYKNPVRPKRSKCKLLMFIERLFTRASVN